MARRVGGGEEGSVKAAEGAAERSKQSGEPLQVPPDPAMAPSEAGVLDKRRNLGSVPNCIGNEGPGVAGQERAPLRWVTKDATAAEDKGGNILPPSLVSVTLIQQQILRSSW